MNGIELAARSDLARDQRLLEDQRSALAPDQYYGYDNAPRYYNRGWSFTWRWR